MKSVNLPAVDEYEVKLDEVRVLTAEERNC